jgi:hypothetical protein
MGTFSIYVISNITCFVHGLYIVLFPSSPSVGKSDYKPVFFCRISLPLQAQAYRISLFFVALVF